MTPENQTVMDREPLHQLLTGAQSSLFAFICSLLGESVNARDVLQETNLVLWEKEAEFDRSRAFLPWAFGIAHMQVLAFRKRQQRDRLTFADGLVETLASESVAHALGTDGRLEALDKCIEKLPESQRDLLRKFYGQGVNLAAIGRSLGKQGNTVAASLYRIRKILSNCVNRTLNSDGAV